MSWNCSRCGSEDIDIVHVITKGRWRVYATCRNRDCRANLVINKYGIGAKVDDGSIRKGRLYE